jgi:hypothetical protein
MDTATQLVQAMSTGDIMSLIDALSALPGAERVDVPFGASVAVMVRIGTVNIWRDQENGIAVHAHEDEQTAIHCHNNAVADCRRQTEALATPQGRLAALARMMGIDPGQLAEVMPGFAATVDGNTVVHAVDSGRTGMYL